MEILDKQNDWYWYFREKDIDEVLQTHTVFANVSKGQAAKKEDIVKAFGTDNQTEICKEILAKGELQITDKERQSHNEQVCKDIATTLANTCINPELKRPYPVTMIEKAMKEVHFSVKPNQSTKQQAVQVIKLIQEKNIMPIERAKMKLKVNFSGSSAKSMREKLLQVESIEIEKEESSDNEITLVFNIDPGSYKGVDSLVKSEGKGSGLIEILWIKLLLEMNIFI